MGLKTNLAYLTIGVFSQRHFPKIALEALEEGFDSPSLVMLAGLTEQDDLLLRQQYFDNALAELGLQLPEDTEARLHLASVIARSVLDNRTDLMIGVAEMNNIIRNGDFYNNTKRYVYDGIGYEKIYGLYSDIEDAIEDEVYWRNLRPDFDKMIAEAKNSLFDELKIWLTRYGTLC